MIQFTIDWILNNWITGWFGLFLYWLPFMVCVVGYTIRTFENYQNDLLERDKYLRFLQVKKENMDNETQLSIIKGEKYSHYYSPTDKIGTLIGRALVSILPVANLWAGMFDVSPRLFKRLFDFIEKVFDTPLVSRPKEE